VTVREPKWEARGNASLFCIWADATRGEKKGRGGFDTTRDLKEETTHHMKRRVSSVPFPGLRKMGGVPPLRRFGGEETDCEGKHRPEEDEHGDLGSEGGV